MTDMQTATVLSIFEHSEEGTTSGGRAAADSPGAPYHFKPLARNELQIIETILDKREIGGSTEYLCRWFGMPVEYDTWEPRAHIFSPEIIEEFEQVRKTAGQSEDEQSVTESLEWRPRRSKKVERFQAGTATENNRQLKAKATLPRGITKFGVFWELPVDADIVANNNEVTMTAVKRSTVNRATPKAPPTVKSSSAPAKPKVTPKLKVAPKLKSSAKSPKAEEKKSKGGKSQSRKRTGPTLESGDVQPSKVSRAETSGNTSTKKGDHARVVPSQSSKVVKAGSVVQSKRVTTAKTISSQPTAAPTKSDAKKSSGTTDPPKMTICEVTNDRLRGGTHEYAVIYSGATSRDPTWVPKDEVPGNLIAEYHSRNYPIKDKAPESESSQAPVKKRPYVSSPTKAQPPPPSVSYEIIGRRFVEGKAVFLIAKKGQAVGWKEGGLLDASIVDKYVKDGTRRVYDRSAPQTGSTYSVDYIAEGPRRDLSGNTEYRVKWSGYTGEKALAWVSVKAISKDLIDEYDSRKSGTKS